MSSGWQLAVVSIAIVLWFGVSWFWYVCDIKGMCSSSYVVTYGDEKQEQKYQGISADIFERDTVQVTTTKASRKQTRTSEEKITITCPSILNTPLRYGYSNSSYQMKQLEQFLNEELDLDLPVDGYFSRQDERAVEDFQEKYREEILEPWGRTSPTGFVYTTTLKQINVINCLNQYEDQN